MVKRTVLYARASDDNESNLHYAIDMCREYAETQGYDVVAELAEDDGCTPCADAQSIRAMEMADAGEFDVLVVREVGRLSPSLAKQLLSAERLRPYGIEIAEAIPGWPDMFKGNQPKDVRALANEYDYLLGRRLTCGECGSDMRGTWIRVPDPPRTYLYYRCLACVGAPANVTCDMPYFRADHVDDIVWRWVRSLVTDLDAVVDWIGKWDDDCQALADLLVYESGMVAHRVANCQAQLEVLNDLYVPGELSKQRHANRKTALEQEIADLEHEWERLSVALEQHTPADRHREPFAQVAQLVAARLGALEHDPRARRHVIEMLGVRATLAIEDGGKVVHARSALGDAILISSTWPAAPTTTSRGYPTLA